METYRTNFDKNMYNNLYKIYILNLPRSKERLTKIKSNLDNPKCPSAWEKIISFDGKNINNDIRVYKILSPYQYLVGKKLKCNESNEEWVYNGMPNKSFPGLHLNGHSGNKGLILSNLYAMEKAYNDNKLMPNKWNCIAEDDSVLDCDTKNKIYKELENIPINIKVANLDKRLNGIGSSFNCYRTSILPKLLKELNPLSNFSINHEIKYGRSNLWDWLLFDCLSEYNIPHTIKSIVNSGNFTSTIS